jgi:hypothetical protein
MRSFPPSWPDILPGSMFALVAETQGHNLATCQAVKIVTMKTQNTCTPTLLDQLRSTVTSCLVSQQWFDRCTRSRGQELLTFSYGLKLPSAAHETSPLFASDTPRVWRNYQQDRTVSSSAVRTNMWFFVTALGVTSLHGYRLDFQQANEHRNVPLPGPQKIIYSFRRRDRLVVQLQWPWEATIRSFSQEGTSLLWKTKIHYSVQIMAAVSPVLSQVSPVQTLEKNYAY